MGAGKDALTIVFEALILAAGLLAVARGGNPRIGVSLAAAGIWFLSRGNDGDKLF